MQQPSQAEYLKRRQVLNDAFDSGIFICFQFDNPRMKRLQEYRHLKPLPASDQEAYAQELAWKEIEIDIAVANKDAFIRAHSEQRFPQVPTEQFITNTEPKLLQTEIDKVRPEFAETGIVRPNKTIQVLYDPNAYNPKRSLGNTREWRTVPFLFLSDDAQQESAARLEKWLKAQRPGDVTYSQQVYLRQALKPQRFVQLWDHAVLLMHHWLKAWIFMYRRDQDFKNLWEATKMFEDFKAREPIEEWHFECMEKYWVEGMGEQAGVEP